MNLRPRLSTNTKLAIARGLRPWVLAARRLAGKSGSQTVATRGGIRWSLDLDEGIDFSIYLLGRFEPSTTRLIASRLGPGMVALDIGANVGAHALRMAQAVGPTGRVYAIEPTRWAFDRLEKNRELNPALRAALIPIHALLGTLGAAVPESFFASWSIGAEAGGHALHGGAPRGLDGAPLYTLDQLVEARGLTRLDLIKLDVDGWECSILEGGRKTLDRFGPPIVLELAPHVLDEHGGSLTQLLGILSELGYRLRSERLERALPTSTSEIARLIPAGGSINVLAVRGG